MSTRGIYYIINKEGKCATIYKHYDNDPEGAKKNLSACFKDKERMSHLKERPIEAFIAAHKDSNLLSLVHLDDDQFPNKTADYWQEFEYRLDFRGEEPTLAAQEKGNFDLFFKGKLKEFINSTIGDKL